MLRIYITEALIGNWLKAWAACFASDVYLFARLFYHYQKRGFLLSNSIFLVVDVVLCGAVMYRDARTRRREFIQKEYNRQTIHSVNHFLQSIPEGIIIFEGRSISFYNEYVLDTLGIDHGLGPETITLLI